MFEVIAEGYVTVADEGDPTPAQCSWGAGGDPASGCDNLAGPGDVCEHHAAVLRVLTTHGIRARDLTFTGEA